MRYTYSNDGRTYVHMNEQEAAEYEASSTDWLTPILSMFVLIMIIGAPILWIGNAINGYHSTKKTDEVIRLTSERIGLEAERKIEITRVENQIRRAQLLNDRDEQKRLKEELQEVHRKYRVLIQDAREKESIVLGRL